MDGSCLKKKKKGQLLYSSIKGDRKVPDALFSQRKAINSSNEGENPELDTFNQAIPPARKRALGSAKLKR